MHALQRPQLPRVLGTTVLAAVLALAFTLALAGRVSDLGPTGSAGAGAAGAAGVDHHPAAAAAGVLATSVPAWTHSPFAGPTTGPAVLPWPTWGRPGPIAR
jgi:hypothetical protein